MVGVDKSRSGTRFKLPSVRVLCLYKANRPPRLFGRDEIRKMLKTAPTTEMEAMILLGLNAALRNHAVGANRTTVCRSGVRYVFGDGSMRPGTTASRT